jgi:[protein-PII] uridylyltransferase
MTIMTGRGHGVKGLQARSWAVCGRTQPAVWQRGAVERDATAAVEASGEAFARRREALLADRRLRGSAFGAALAGLVDEWLASLLGDEQGVAVLAVGGYGRRELCPGSDLDVVLVHRGGRGVAALAERLWYPIWDAKIALDHSVRTAKEVLRAADQDLRVALGLLDGRYVAGDEALVAEVLGRLEQQWRRRARRVIAELSEAVVARHARAGEVAFLLEPDLKEAKGGLRDVQVLRALARAAPVVPPADLDLAGPAETLLAVRVELHRVTGRAQDRLPLQDQDAVAQALGCEDADALARTVASAARRVAWASDDAWSRAASWLAGPRGRVVGGPRRVAPGVVVRDGEVDLDVEPGAADLTTLWRAAAASAHEGLPLARACLRRFVAEVPAPPDPWPEEARRTLVSLLGAGKAAVGVLETLDQHELVSRALPEWEAVRSRPQRNAYHRYTVDRHLFETAAEAAALVRRVHRPDLLLIAALLHDIGKGSPGDHTEAGVALVARIARRMGFPSSDVEVLVRLVRHHLLLADTAMRRDLADPATAAAVARAVEDHETLELLAALTEADSKATGPTAWGSWKEGLVSELVRRTTEVLAGTTLPAPTGPPPGAAELLAAAGGGWFVNGQGCEVTVVAPDRPGLFCLLAGTLALEGLNVLSADAWSSEEGMAVDRFRVEPEFGGEPDWERFGVRLREHAERPELLEGRLDRRVSAYGRTRRPGAARPAYPTVKVDNAASATATVVEVAAADAVGVLYRIARALARLGLDIRHAKALTLGHEVVDSFYVRDPAGGKLTDPERLALLEREILAELGDSAQAERA